MSTNDPAADSLLALLDLTGQPERLRAFLAERTMEGPQPHLAGLEALLSLDGEQAGEALCFMIRQREPGSRELLAATLVALRDPRRRAALQRLLLLSPDLCDLVASLLDRLLPLDQESEAPPAQAYVARH